MADTASSSQQSSGTPSSSSTTTTSKTTKHATPVGKKAKDDTSSADSTKQREAAKRLSERCGLVIPTGKVNHIVRHHATRAGRKPIILCAAYTQKVLELLLQSVIDAHPSLESSTNDEGDNDETKKSKQSRITPKMLNAGLRKNNSLRRIMLETGATIIDGGVHPRATEIIQKEKEIRKKISAIRKDGIKKANKLREARKKQAVSMKKSKSSSTSKSK